MENEKRMITNGVTVQQWIPVDERLPDDREKVLAFHKTTYGRYHDIVRFANCLEDVDNFDLIGHKHSGFYKYDGEYGYYEVTNISHWMPLPEPPEGE